MKIPAKYKFIIQVGLTLHRCGVQSYKIQYFLNQIAKKQGLKGNFVDFPNWVNYTFYGDSNSNLNPYVYSKNVPLGQINLGALSKCVDITNQVLNGELFVDSAKLELTKMFRSPPKQNSFILILAFCLSSGAFSLVLNTNWNSVAIATLMGVIVYGLYVLSKRSKYINSISDSLVCFLITVFVSLLSFVIPNVNIALTILSSIIILVPGLTLTTALEEITSKQLVSGSAKFFDGIVSLFKQFFGVFMGISLISIFREISFEPTISTIPVWLSYLSVPLLSLSVIPIFQVRKRERFWSLLTGITAFFVTVLFAKSGVMIATFLGTLSVVFCSNIFHKITKAPKTVFQTQGVLLLVPGSKAFLGLSSLMVSSQVADANNMGEQVTLILMGVIGGFIFSGIFKQT